MIELCDIFSLDSPAKQQVLFVRQPFNLSSFRAIFGVAIFYGSRSDSLKFSVSLSAWRAAEVLDYEHSLCFLIVRRERSEKKKMGRAKVGGAKAGENKGTARSLERYFLIASFQIQIVCFERLIWQCVTKSNQLTITWHIEMKSTSAAIFIFRREQIKRFSLYKQGTDARRLHYFDGLLFKNKG